MFGPRKVMKKNTVTVEDNEMYIESIAGRLNTALRVSGKNLYSELYTAVQQRRTAAVVHGDIKRIYQESHKDNSYGDSHVDPGTLKAQRESVHKTQKELNVADEKIHDLKKDIAELVEENRLNANENEIITNIEDEIYARDKALALKIEKFYEEIQSEYEDVNKTKKNIQRLHQLDDGLKSFSNHNFVEPRVTNSSIELHSAAALNKIKSL